MERYEDTRYIRHIRHGPGVPWRVVISSVLAAFGVAALFMSIATQNALFVDPPALGAPPATTPNVTEPSDAVGDPPVDRRNPNPGDCCDATPSPEQVTSVVPAVPVVPAAPVAPMIVPTQPTQLTSPSVASVVVPQQARPSLGPPTPLPTSHPTAAPAPKVTSHGPTAHPTPPPHPTPPAPQPSKSKKHEVHGRKLKS